MYKNLDIFAVRLVPGSYVLIIGFPYKKSPYISELLKDIRKLLNTCGSVL